MYSVMISADMRLSSYDVRCISVLVFQVPYLIENCDSYLLLFCVSRYHRAASGLFDPISEARLGRHLQNGKIPFDTFVGLQRHGPFFPATVCWDTSILLNYYWKVSRFISISQCIHIMLYNMYWCISDSISDQEARNTKKKCWYNDIKTKESKRKCKNCKGTGSLNPVVRKNPGVWWAEIPLRELPEDFKQGPNADRVRITEVPDDDPEASPGTMMEVAVIGPHSARWIRERVLDDYVNGQHRVHQEQMSEFFKMEDV
jgi:hypothetical protein